MEAGMEWRSWKLNLTLLEIYPVDRGTWPCTMGCTSSTIGTTPRISFSDFESGLSDSWLLSTIRNGPRGELAERLVGVTSWKEVMADNAAGIKKKDGGGASGSLLKRITLKYKDGEKLPEDPDTLILKYVDTMKLAALDAGVRLLFTLLDGRGGGRGYFNLISRSEFWYYNNFKQLDQSGYRTPVCYASILADATNPSTCGYVCCDVRAKTTLLLLLEDLQNYESFTPFSFQPVNLLIPAFANVAKLHSNWWGKHMECGPTSNPASNLWHDLQFGCGSILFPDKMKFIKQAARNPAKAIQNIVTHSNGGWLRHVPKLKDSNYTDAIHTYLTVCQTNFSSVMGNVTPQTVVHGDFHHWNTMFRKTHADPTLDPVVTLDFQCWGPGRPAYDFAYFLTLSTSPDYDEDQRLLDAYWCAFDKENPTVATTEYTKSMFESDVFISIMDMVAAGLNNMRKKSGGITSKTLDAWEADPKQADLKIGALNIHNNTLDRLVAYIERRPELFQPNTLYVAPTVETSTTSTTTPNISPLAVDASGGETKT